MKHKTKFKQTEIGLIPKDWEINKLEKLIFIKGRIGWKGLKKSEFGKNGVIIINGPDIKNSKVNWDNCLRVPKWRHGESEEISVKVNDILMTKDGTIGKTAIVNNLPEPATVASGIFLIRSISKQLHQEYLYQYFNSRFFKKLIKSRIEGSVIPHLYQKDIIKLSIPLPSLEEQRRITKTLSDLDSKIELNYKMNQTLERTAQTIFKHWFIDYEFPDDDGKPFRSSGGVMTYNKKIEREIPKGWEAKPIDLIADFLNGLALQNYPTKNVEKYLPVIKIRELKQGITSSSDKASINIPSKYIIKNGDVLFSWSGSLHVSLWAFGSGALNQHLFKVTSQYPKWFYYYWIMEYLHEYQRIAKDKATTMGHIKREHLTKSLVLIPTIKILQQMNGVLDPIIKKIIQIRIESNNILQLRDLLLSKLVSGKIRMRSET